MKWLRQTMVQTGCVCGALLLFAPQLAEAQVTTRSDEVGRRLNQWFAEGSAAGLKAITYENRDGGHSLLEPGMYPGLQVFQPDPRSGPPTGPAMMLRRQPTLGNCSMAASASQGGSIPRLYQMDVSGQRFLALQYLTNNLFIYPEHQDHDLGSNGVGGYGDLYPANNACSIITQGSSGSDVPFLQAMLAAAAALPPETQRVLIDKRLLMPTLQALLRQSSRRVRVPEDYFSGQAHPPVFDVADLDELRLVEMAHALQPTQIPPLAQIEVLRETLPASGLDYFEASPEPPWRLGDTPVAVARVLRAGVHSMLLSAEKSADLNGRDVQLRWVLLQGNPEAVRIETSVGGKRARVEVRGSFPVRNAAGRFSHRVDIGLFAIRGGQISAPAFVTFYQLPNEARFYDANGQLTEVVYQAHSPDCGLPLAAEDPLWRGWKQALANTGGGWLNKRLQPLIHEKARNLLSAWQPDQAPSADLRAEIEQIVFGLARQTDLFLNHQTEVRELAALSSKPGAWETIRRTAQRLVDLGVLIEDAHGVWHATRPLSELSAGERYGLEGLHLTVLSQVLFPALLERSEEPAWVDSRLTTPKAWRDVLRRDDQGRLTGWTRYGQQRVAAFDEHGQERSGPQTAQPVIYQKNAAGWLEWQPRKR